VDEDKAEAVIWPAYIEQSLTDLVVRHDSHIAVLEFG
jgi:hypothetical protein